MPFPVVCCMIATGVLSLLLTGCSNLVHDNQEASNEGESSHQTTLCHTASDGSFRLLAESRSEWPSHLLHGDGIPAGPVPGRDGFVFTATCQVVKDSDEGACPSGMAHINDFCIDRWEADLLDHLPYTVPQAGVAQTAQGVIPHGYISGEVAEAACQAAGKRLCRNAEWLRACQGPSEETFPYGDTYIPTACNEGRTQHPVIELFGDQTDWSSRQMNDPRINQLADGLDATGSHPVCMSAEGVFDMHGNLHEWVADVDGTFRGGFYVDAKINGQGCKYRTTAHGRTYHDYSTGFRCCSDAR